MYGVHVKWRACIWEWGVNACLEKFIVLGFNLQMFFKGFIVGIIKWVNIDLDVPKRVRETSAVTNKGKSAAIYKHAIL